MYNKFFRQIFLLIAFATIQIFIGGCHNQKANDDKIIKTESGSIIHENDVALKLAELERKGKIKESNSKKSFLLFARDTIMDMFKDLDLDYRLTECADKWTVFQDKHYFIVSGIAMKDISVGYLFSIVYKTNGLGHYALINCQVANRNLKGSYPIDIIPMGQD